MSPIVLVLLFLLVTGSGSAVLGTRNSAPPPGTRPPGYGPPGYSPGYGQGGPISPGTAAAAGEFIKQLIGPSSGGSGSSATGYGPTGYPLNSGSPGSSSFTPYAPGASAPGPYAPSTGDGLLPAYSDASTSGDVSNNDTYYA